MSEKVNENLTPEELEQMANALLEENAPAAEKKEEKKSSKGKLDDKTIEKLPAAALIMANEKLRDLLNRGKKKGRLDSSEISEVVDEMDLGSEAMDQVYDSLEALGIEVGVEEFLVGINDDIEPPMSEIAEIEEEERRIIFTEIPYGVNKSLLCESIAQCVKELEPEETEVYEMGSVRGRDPETEKLPSVVYVMQPQSQMEEMGYNDLVYGWDMNHVVPTVMHPNEILDGATGNLLCTTGVGVLGSFMDSLAVTLYIASPLTEDRLDDKKLVPVMGFNFKF